MKKVIDLFIKLYTNTVATWHFPFVDKKFELLDYYEIEKKLRELEVPFAVVLVNTYGHGSSIGIRLAGWIGRRLWSKKTHVAIYIDLRKGYKHRAVEAVSEGIREVPLVKAIGQRDEVLVRVPDRSLLNEAVSSKALEYIHSVLDLDDAKNIEYDFKHDLLNDETQDCAELFYNSLKYGFEKADQYFPLKPIMRAGMPTFTPVDVEKCELFVDLYDSKRGGFVKG